MGIHRERRPPELLASGPAVRRLSAAGRVLLLKYFPFDRKGLQAMPAALFVFRKYDAPQISLTPGRGESYQSIR